MRFLGKKTKLIEKIEYVIKDNEITAKIFYDLFLDSSSVGDFFKNKSKIISNNYMHSSSNITKDNLHYSNIPKFKLFVKKYSNNILI